MIDIQSGSNVIRIRKSDFERHISRKLNESVRFVKIERLSSGFHSTTYNAHLVTKSDIKRNVIIKFVEGKRGWGHEYVSDRAGVVLFQHHSINHLEKAGKSLDVIGIDNDGRIISIGECIEYLQIIQPEENVQPYASELLSKTSNSTLTEADLLHVNKLAEWLARLHTMKIDSLTDREAKNHYMRHVRDLVGHGEMTMGIIDSYSYLEKLDFSTPKELVEIEKKMVEWRVKIKTKVHRLARIHGDVHPYNIHFYRNDDFVVFDPSRVEYGEPADDVSCLTIFYIFFSLLIYDRYVPPFKTLLEKFYKRYIDLTRDDEIFTVIAPFLAFRALSKCNSYYYPKFTAENRRRMLTFMNNVLRSERFVPGNVSVYLSQNQSDWV